MTSGDSGTKLDLNKQSSFDNVILRSFKNWYAQTNKLFRLTVLFPTLLAIFYFGFFQSDIYVSESRFVVRTASTHQNLGLSAFLQGSGLSHSSEDTYSVHDYILSRDALEKLNKQINLFKSFGGSHIDVFNRFAGFNIWDHTFESLYRYYQDHIVDIQDDAVSSIAVLTVRAFNAEDAYRINQILLNMSEGFINKLNERAQQDMIRFATREVQQAEDKAKAAALAVSNYRIQKEVFDPERQSALELEQVSKLQDRLIATQSQLEFVRHFTPNNPQISSLEKQVENFKSAINNEMNKVAGKGASLTNKVTEYQRLILERDFAGKQLVTALASLEQARNEAQRQQIYLARIAEPNKPDKAIEPHRIRNILATFILALVAWGILTLLIANFNEHMN